MNHRKIIDLPELITVELDDYVLIRDTSDVTDKRISINNLLSSCVGGNTGNTDNTILISNGTGGQTLQAATNAIINDSGQMILGGSGYFNSGKIRIGTPDAFGRLQIWNHDVNAVLRLGALGSDGDYTYAKSEGIVVYGKNVQGDDMSSPNFAYARIKPYRMGVYNSKSGVYTGYLFKFDGISNEFYLRDNDGNTVFDVNRTTGDLFISGKAGVNVLNPDSQMEIISNSVDLPTLHLKAVELQTAAILNITDSSDITLFKITKDGVPVFPYLEDAPSPLENGMVWMQSDGLHLYFNDSEQVVAVI